MTAVNKNTKEIRDLAAYVCDRLAGKVLIHRYDAYSTNSVYLKFDYGVRTAFGSLTTPGRNTWPIGSTSF